MSNNALMTIDFYDYVHKKSTKNPRFDELLEVFNFRFGSAVAELTRKGALGMCMCV